MLRLSLLRHAKSSWDDELASDFDRVLAPRGERAAPLIGRYIVQQDLLPDLILCSSAQRTQQTLELAFPRLPDTVEVRHSEEIYLASRRLLRRAVTATDPAFAHLMIIGHNPGMQSLANQLAGSGDDDELAAMARKFPTAALAVIDFDEKEWRQIRPFSGHLNRFVRPKTLKDI